MRYTGTCLEYLDMILASVICHVTILLIFFLHEYTIKLKSVKNLPKKGNIHIESHQYDSKGNFKFECKFSLPLVDSIQALHRPCDMVLKVCIIFLQIKSFSPEFFHEQSLYQHIYLGIHYCCFSMFLLLLLWLLPMDVIRNMLVCF